MPSLADIRKRLAEQENKSKNNARSGDNTIYPHWDIEEETTAVVRFLNDANPDNPYFWVERAMFKFPFNGIKGSTEHGVQASDKSIIVQVPCMEMYGEKDAVLDEVRTWFKDPTMEEMGRKYWKKRSYLFQGFVRQDPMEDRDNYEKPENPIRRFVISPQIFTLIKNSLMDPDIENLPTDEESGLDFRIKKTTKGGYSDYSTSSWARKETALTQEELDAIEKYGLFNLADFLPKKPTEEVQKVILDMFEASVDGEAYDVDRWGRYFTPYGISRITDDSDDDSNSSNSTSKKETTLEDDVSKAEEEVKKASAKVEEKAEKDKEATDTKANDILKMIRERQK